MHYYLIKTNEWNEDITDMEEFHYLVAAETYGEAADVVAKNVGEGLCEFTSILELEEWNNLLTLTNEVYKSLYEGR